MTRVVVLLKSGDGQRLDAYCEAKGHKKSPLIARLIREHLDREGILSQPSLFEASERRAPDREQANEARAGRRDGETGTR